MVSPTHFADVFDALTARFPTADCLVGDGRRQTWEQTRHRALALGSALVARGVGRQGKVAQYLHNCPNYLESVWACLAHGLVPVNTNYRYRDQELHYLWDNADVEAVVFHGAFAETIERIRGDLPGIHTWVWVDDGTGPPPDWAAAYEDLVSSGSPQPAPWDRSGDDLALLYTGGTTGMPKGVMWRMSDYTAVLVGPVDPATGTPEAAGNPAPVHLPACPLMHGVGLHTSFKALSLGGSVVTLGGRRFDAIALLDTVQRERVTSLAIVGDAFAKPIVAALDAEPDRWDISSLTQITSSGVTWSPAAKLRLLHHNPSLVLVDTLGSSEAMGVASSVVHNADEVLVARFMPTANATVMTEDGRVVEPGSGEVGFVAVRGRVPLGYYKDPEKSAATFREVAGERWSIPGDNATLSKDGAIILLGRGSHCINRGGEKIFPEEVEEVLKLFPGIRDALVVGLPDERLGEEIYAVVQAEDNASLAPSDMIAHVRSVLAGYKAPKGILVVEDIGRAANGKPDYGRWRGELEHSLTGSPA